jgi:hypothetical protein
MVNTETDTSIAHTKHSLTRVLPDSQLLSITYVGSYLEVTARCN